MAGEKQHDFHIVDPSPWPVLAAIGTFVMLVGAVLWMHDMTPYAFFAGFAIVLYTMYVWWSDVIKEAHAGDHTPVVQIGLRYGVILFIISEVMFFVAWFWSFFKHAIFPPNANTETGEAGLIGPHVADGVWPPVGIETVDPWHLPVLNTLILLTSGAACTWAHHALMENDRKGLINGLLIAILLGMIFTAVQAYEYYEIVHLDWFQFAGNVYGANFFMATGFHGAHVIIGTLFLAVCLLRALRGHFGPKQHIGFEAAAWYWHFVDVVWIFLFAFIYVWAV
ncbi:MAG: cytochrome c oxidase subunit 3 [Pseudomonadota bacterium]